MVQKRDTALTSKKSRRFTKAVGATSLLSLAIMGASSAYAMKTDFGVNFLAKSYSVRSYAWEGNTTTDGNKAEPRDNGFANLLRVKADFLDEETGVSVHTRLEFAGQRWTGDDLNYNSAFGARGFNTDNRGSMVRLDLGYAQIPLPGKSVLRVGRQASEWNNSFLVGDDRRDRILGIVPTSIGTVLALYDRRGDTQGFFSNDNGDEVGLGLVTRLSGYTVGLLWVHWFTNTSGALSPGVYEFQGADIFSPYISGTVGDDLFELKVGMNWTGNNQLDQYAPGVPFASIGKPGLLLSGSSFAEYVRIEKTLGQFDLGLQWVGAQDGGYLSPAFDTYSSMINSNPESTANPTSMYYLGGKYGLENFNENLVMGRVGYNLTPQWKVTGAVGNLMLDNGSVSDNSMVYDLRASYQVNKAVRVWATAGFLASNKLGTLTGNPLLDKGTFTTAPSGKYQGNNVSFANDFVSSGSLNMQVAF